MQLPNIPEGLHVRPSVASDKAFIERLHRDIRSDLQMIDGEQDYIESIVEMQLRAQTQGYGEAYPNAMYFIIEKHGEKIGKATLDFGHNEVCLIDIGFIPEAQGKGLGKVVIQSFQLAAAQNAVPMTLSVLQHNTVAKKLYISLGFQVEEIRPPYEYMRWYPPSGKIITG